MVQKCWAEQQGLQDYTQLRNIQVLLLLLSLPSPGVNKEP